MQDKELSVLMPVYNYEKYVLETLESIWAQTFSDFEIVVVDDGSADDSYGVCLRAAQRSPQPMRVIQGGRLGVSGAMRLAMEQSHGEFVAVVHADDIHLPTKFERQLQALRADSTLSISHTEYQCVDQEGNDLGFGSRDSDLFPAVGDCLRDILLLRCDVRSVSMMFRREALERRGGYEDRYPYEDWQAILKLAAEGRVHHIAEPLVCRRIHAHNRHINISKFPKFNPDQYAPELLRLLSPPDTDVELVQSVHLGSLIRSSVGSGNVSKGIVGTRFGWVNLPAHRLRHVRSFFVGLCHLAFDRVVRPVTPARGVTWMRSRRAALRRLRGAGSANRARGSWE